MTRLARRSATRAELEQAKTIGAGLATWAADGNLRSFPWRAWRDPYRVTVTEVLLQRTRAETVRELLPGFFKRYPSWRRLAGAEEADLSVVLQPIGLHRRRSRSLIALASAVVAHGPPVDESLPGVGQYVARAAAVSLRNAPEAMVDTNFVRIVRRAFEGPWMADYRYDPRLQAIASTIVRAGSPRHVNWAVMDLGSLICRPAGPRCAACPLAGDCRTGIVAPRGKQNTKFA